MFSGDNFTLYDSWEKAVQHFIADVTSTRKVKKCLKAGLNPLQKISPSEKAKQVECFRPYNH
jgi:hypothetical protein